MTAEAAAGKVAVAEGVRQREGSTECQDSNTQRRDKCQDTISKERQRDSDNVGSCGGSAAGVVGASESKDTTHQHPQHHHHKEGHQTDHRRQQSHGDEAAYRLVPPDGGWGWMVALGTFIITSLLTMLPPCFGVLFSEYLIGAGSSATINAWIFSVQSFIWNISGLPARPLTQEFGWRVVGLTTSAMTAVGIMLSAFTPSPYFLLFSFSLLTGFGGGVVTCQCFTILPLYFERRRGLTNGIMMSGICLAQLVGPPIARVLQVSYGFRGGTLILGALLLNACIGAAFFRPPEWHQKKVLLEEETHENTPEVSIKDKDEASPELKNGEVHSTSQEVFTSRAAEEETEGNISVVKRLLVRHGNRRASCSSSNQSSRYNSNLSLSFMHMGSYTALPVENKPEEKLDEEEERRDILPVRVAKSILNDLGALKSLRVCILCFGDTLCMIAYINFLMMVPFAMLEAGFSLDAAGWCISVSGVSSLVSRFLASASSDWPCSNNRLVYMSGFALTASAIFVFPLMKSVEGLMVVMVVFGIGIGANMSLFNIIIIDVMGLEHLGPVFGTTCLSGAVGFICIGPFVGFMADVTQSYSISMCILGGMAALGLTSWFFMGVAERVDRRREEAKTLRKALQKT